MTNAICIVAKVFKKIISKGAMSSIFSMRLKNPDGILFASMEAENNDPCSFAKNGYLNLS